MIILATKYKSKSPLTAQVTKVWQLTTIKEGKAYTHNFYGYTKKDALLQFKDIIK
jgi:hypothetical protein